jgi:AraC-like DNA-binding protein
MKPKHSFEPHLALRTVTLPPGSEWSIHSVGWSFLHITNGVGYWLHPRENHELIAGWVLVCSDQAPGVVRASQVGELVIHFFRLQPERLTGLVTLGEQQLLQRASVQEASAARLFPPTTPISEKFGQICQGAQANTLPLRLQLLDVFMRAFADELTNHKPGAEPPPDAKARLVNLLNEIPVSELLDLSFADLVREMRCTPRHLSRIFHQVVGMSFRDKQAQIRLVRAQELLATTESKVVEVALESGYQSLSLFNVMFKRQFGLTPARWRNQSKSRRRPAINGRRLQMVRAY